MWRNLLTILNSSILIKNLNWISGVLVQGHFDLVGITQGECQDNKDGQVKWWGGKGQWQGQWGCWGMVTRMTKGVYMDVIIGRQPNFLY